MEIRAGYNPISYEKPCKLNLPYILKIKLKARFFKHLFTLLPVCRESIQQKILQLFSSRFL